MGTDYSVVKNSKNECEIEIYEHSNKFDIAITDQAGQVSIVKKDLTTEQLLDVGLKIIQVASYWDGELGEYVNKRTKEFF